MIRSAARRRGAVVLLAVAVATASAAKTKLKVKAKPKPPPPPAITLRLDSFEVSFDLGLSTTDGAEERTDERSWGGGASLAWLALSDARGTKLNLGTGASLHHDRTVAGSEGTIVDTLDVDAVKLEFLTLWGVPLEEYAKPSLGVGEQRNATQRWDAEEGSRTDPPFWAPTWFVGLSIPLHVPVLAGASLDVTYRHSFSSGEAVSSFETGLSLTVLDAQEEKEKDEE